MKNIIKRTAVVISISLGTVNMISAAGYGSLNTQSTTAQERYENSQNFRRISTIGTGKRFGYSKFQSEQIRMQERSVDRGLPLPSNNNYYNSNNR